MSTDSEYVRHHLGQWLSSINRINIASMIGEEELDPVTSRRTIALEKMLDKAVKAIDSGNITVDLEDVDLTNEYEFCAVSELTGACVMAARFHMPRYEPVATLFLALAHRFSLGITEYFDDKYNYGK